MIIINEANYGEKTYVVSVGTGLAWLEQFTVAAYHETEAADIVADYLESQGIEGLYYDNLELELLAWCSEWKTPEAFAEAHNLTCCGNHNIYVEIVNIEEVA